MVISQVSAIDLAGSQTTNNKSNEEKKTDIVCLQHLANSFNDSTSTLGVAVIKSYYKSDKYFRIQLIHKASG